MDSRLLIFFIIFSSSRPAGGQQVFDDFYPEEPDQISSKQGTILITEDHQHSITTPRLVEWFVLLGGETMNSFLPESSSAVCTVLTSEIRIEI